MLEEKRRMIRARGGGGGFADDGGRERKVVGVVIFGGGGRMDCARCGTWTERRWKRRMRMISYSQGVGISSSNMFTKTSGSITIDRSEIFQRAAFSFFFVFSFPVFPPAIWGVCHNRALN